MEQFKENPIAVGLTFEEYLLLRLEAAEAAYNALMELTGINNFFTHIPGVSNPEDFDEWVESQHDSEEWRNDNV